MNEHLQFFSYMPMPKQADKLRTAARKIFSFVYRGNKFYCPVCNQTYRKFFSAGVNQRPNALCPGCNSLERHRLFWMVFQKLAETGILKTGGRMLHIAPEPSLSEKFMKQYDYISVDLDGSNAMFAMDITALTFPDEHFDVIVCHHVLEHIPDDRKAISELYRVLKSGGWASIQVPIKGEITQEDMFITDPHERRQLYGQEDHVRKYGHDFIYRLEEAGFSLQIFNKADVLDPFTLECISVKCENEVIFAGKQD
ncbi:MAG: methyltransferase domain-containing protein [Desulfococcaceae bacterium]|jgi:SAM-dependent methyltransferase|nr:methyltransferase domain-containing protein [Desulfococcaceae bacterium]